MVTINDLFKVAVKTKASDLLIVADSPPYVRINGKLIPVAKEILTANNTKKLVFSILSEHQVKIFDVEKSVDLSYCYQENASLPGQEKHRFRINVYQQQGTISAACRTISNVIPSLNELGLPDTLKEFAKLPQGLLLVTGPTGHGKSTTLASMVDYINVNQAKHIITVEDPIEYVHVHKKSVVEQRELGRDTPTFQQALKYVLRQDPDVILVGEMRDLETMSCALTAAETGHLVLATLHTNDAVQSIDRIVDTYPAHQQSQVRTQLALSLAAVVSQRLLPHTNGKQRVLACEILINNSAIANLIREGNTHQVPSVIETRVKEKMLPFDHSLRSLYERGCISYDIAKSYMSKAGKAKLEKRA